MLAPSSPSPRRGEGWREGRGWSRHEGLGDSKMAWKLDGTYFENCSCEMVCPCTTSGFSAKASYDRCSFLLVFHIDRGTIEGTDVSGLTVGLIGNTPQVMINGDWHLGILMDDKASKDQQDNLVAVFAGQKGGPMAGPATLVSKILGVERVPIKYADKGHEHTASMGPDIHVGVEDFVGGTLTAPQQVVGVAHPANSTLTIAAMMLPSVAPVAILYERSITANRIPRLAVFAASYLVVWGLAGLPAFAIAAALSSVSMDHPQITRYVAAGIFLILGLYQVSPIKDRCLSRCRSPFSLLMHYANFHGPLRDLRAGTHHALYCLGCCWALMLVLVVAGIMNLLVMVVLAAVILIEKYWSQGSGF